jgi:SPP1 gp7 family putative phage head morphogenesis protein
MIAVTTYKKQERVDYKSLIVVNKAIQNYDPTRTTVLRSQFMKDMERRFTMLARDIKKAIIEDDIFGLIEPKHDLVKIITVNETPGKEAFKFATSQEKVNGFMTWLKQQEKQGLLQITTIPTSGTPIEKAWTDQYIQDSYKRGVTRARYEMGTAGMGTPGMDTTGGISASMSTPFHMDRVGMLYARTFEDLIGITAAMDSNISRILSQGMVDGDGPRSLAGKIVDATKISRNRAMTLARTEIIRAHHSAMVQEYKNWAVEGVVVKAEWVDAGFNVCPECAKNNGKIFDLNEIEGLIPLHPNCFVDSQIPVYTSEGWKAIGKVKVGDYVLTHEKRFKKVYALPRSKGNENTEVITFKFKGDIKISITANHPILIKKGNRLIWKEAGKCTIEDKVMFLADTCQRCNTSIPYFRKYCSRICLSLDITDRQWANPEHRKNVSEKNSISNKLQYASGERDRFETTRKANEKTRELVKEGNWILQEKWVHDKSNEVNNTPEQRKASSERMKLNNPMNDPIVKEKAQEALRIVYQKFPEKRLNARMARLRCSGNMTWIEKRMADLLDRIGIEYISQYPILNYNADFVIPSLRIVIECDGEHWHQDKEKDAIRQKRIEDEGWFVLRYTGTKINQCIDEIGAELLRVVSNHRGKYNTVNWEIESIKRWNLKTNRTLYNLSVEGDESYIAKGLIVHNCRCIALPTMPEKGVKTVEKVQESGDFTPNTPKQIKNAQIEMNKYIDTLNINELEIVKDYTHNDYPIINGRLRLGVSSSQFVKKAAEFNQKIKVLDDFIASAPKFKGTTNRFYNVGSGWSDLSQLKKGDLYTDKAFMSTTAKDKFISTTKEVQLVIEGKNGVLIQDLSIHKSEQEILFGRDSKFVVDHVEIIKQPGQYTSGELKIFLIEL